MKITVEQILAKNPCTEWTEKRLRKYIGEGKTLSEILNLKKISIDDKIWCVTKFLPDAANRIFAIWCARQCSTKYKEIATYIEVIEAYYAGQATKEELQAADRAADWATCSAAYSAADWAADRAARSATYSAAYRAAYWAAYSAARSAARRVAYRAAYWAADSAADRAAYKAADRAADSAADWAADWAAYSAARSAARRVAYRAAYWAADSAAYIAAYRAAGSAARSAAERKKQLRKLKEIVKGV